MKSKDVRATSAVIIFISGLFLFATATHNNNYIYMIIGMLIIFLSQYVPDYKHDALCESSVGDKNDKQ